MKLHGSGAVLVYLLFSSSALFAQSQAPDAESSAPSSLSETAATTQQTAQASTNDVPPPAAQQQDPVTTLTTQAVSEPKQADALAITVSGAVSLGSHEAGQLFLITEALRKSPGSTPLRVATGASAGSANALLYGNEACLQQDITAEQSLGYRVWVGVGLDELFDPEKTTRQAIFHGEALKLSYGYLEEVWKRGLPESCEFAFGAAVTRKPATDMKLVEGIHIVRSAEHFVVRIKGQRSGPPTFSNYVDTTSTYQRPLLPFTGVFADDALALRPVVVASAAFPIAFPAEPIEHCIANKSNTGDQCAAPTHVDSFVDGGVFDNNPLGIAYRTALGGLMRNGAKVALRSIPDGRKHSDLDVLYGFVDPDLRSYPSYTPPKAAEEPDDDPVMSLVTSMGGQMLDNARGHELASLADENYELLENLWLIRGNYPPISELLGAFFGFFERDFRDFDFHLGTYDSFVDLRDRSAVRLGSVKFIEQLDATFKGDVKGVPQRYKKLACIASHLGSKPYQHLKAACGGDDMRNFRVLLQVAIDRLWSNCRMLSPEQVATTEHLGCKQAQGGLHPPVVDASFAVRGPRYQTQKESQFDYSLRLLSDYDFHFRDLGLSANQADRARVTVRRKLIAMVEALSAAQGSFLDRTAALTAGRTLINSIYYEPPKKRAYLGLGSAIFAGYLGRWGGLRALYFNPDLRMLNLRDMLSGGNFSFSVQASLGAELAILPLSGRVWQSSIGVRAGYQFAATDSIGFNSCEENKVAGDSRFCSGPVIHTPVNFTLLERIRFAVTPVFYPLPRDFGHNVFELELGIGAELY